MRNYFILIMILLLIRTSVSGQKEGIASINEEDLKANMDFFASDLLNGRETGTEANDIAALYIKTNLIRLGLKPGGDDYYQHMPMVYLKNLMEESYLKILDNDGKSIYSTDSIMLLTTGNRTMEAEGNVVFAGYGYKDEQSGYNDFEGIDLQDKIVMFMTRTPDMVKDGEGKTSVDIQSEQSKIMNILSSGARAILFVFDPSHEIQDPFKSILYQFTRSGQVTLDDTTSRSFPVILGMIKPKTADQLLKPAGKTLLQYQDDIITSGKPVSFEVPGISVSMRAVVEKRKFDGKNVIGIVEGSDPVLKNECIVYTAHFDHVGKDSEGMVFNGADDNASGSMALIEIAQAFMNLKRKPRRSIAFVWVNGEEKGLIGSQYYVNKPVFPLDKTLLDINLDMIGRSKTPADTGYFFGMSLNVTNPGEVMMYTMHESSELMKMISSSANSTGIKVIDMGEDIEAGSSDHESFWNKGIPAVMFHTGIHADLHQITDDENKIDYDKMEHVTKLVFQLGYMVANQRERFRIDKPVTKN